MKNLLSFLGSSLQSEVCLWTLVGLLRTVFDATLFKVNANLKLVWQMYIVEDLSMPVQRALRTMISGVMLMQCFTLYVYLAAYIVLLYPVFLEERPALVIPWLLVAAIRKLLCELMSLALGLGTCVLVGPARPSCIKFVVFKVSSIMPAFYMWMLVYSYYHSLKITSAFKTFPAVISSDRDYGLELAIRRRRTKSLRKEDELRHTLINNLTQYNNMDYERQVKSTDEKTATYSRMVHSTNTNNDDGITGSIDLLQPLSVASNRSIQEYDDDWLGIDVNVPRDTDRIMEQFVSMMLRIAVYLKMDNEEAQKLFNPSALQVPDTRVCNAMPPDSTETPPQVGSTTGKTASYLRNYPQIFMKKSSEPHSRQTHSEKLADRILIDTEYKNIDDTPDPEQFSCKGCTALKTVQADEIKKTSIKTKDKSVGTEAIKVKQLEINSQTNISITIEVDPQMTENISTTSAGSILSVTRNINESKENQDRDSLEYSSNL